MGPTTETIVLNLHDELLDMIAAALPETRVQSTLRSRIRFMLEEIFRLRAALGRSVPQEQVADRVDEIIRSALSGDEPSFRTPEGHIRWGRVGHEIRVVILAADLGGGRSVPAEPTPEPSEEAVRAAFGVLYGKPPEWEMDGQDHTICPRDWERIQEIRAMLRAAYAIDRRGAPPQGEPPNFLGIPPCPCCGGQGICANDCTVLGEPPTP